MGASGTPASVAQGTSPIIDAASSLKRRQGRIGCWFTREAEMGVAVAPDIPSVPPVDLRQVLYFVTVARELNFTRAAERLHISPPALSQQIKALERHLGVQLLQRNTRHVHLTAAGEVFARSSHGLLHEGEAAVLEARKTAGLINGKLLLAVLHEAEPAFEPFLTKFHNAYPGIQFKVATLRHAELLAALRNRTADAGLTWSFLLERVGDNDEIGRAHV